VHEVRSFSELGTGAGTSNSIAYAPGTVGFTLYENYDDCVAASLLLPPKTFTVDRESRIGIWLFDGAADNVEGRQQNPAWSLSHEGCE